MKKAERANDFLPPRRNAATLAHESLVQRLVAAMLCMSILPMPFVGLWMPVFWIIAFAVAARAWWRAPDTSTKISNTTQNLLAIGILVACIAAGGRAIGPLRPLGHMLLLLASVRILVVRDHISARKALMPILMLWLMSIASSTDLMLLVYLLASIAGWWWAAMVLLQVEGLVEERASLSMLSLPRARMVLAASLIALILAVPVFVLMPRLRSPFLSAATGGDAEAGFSETVELGEVGSIRQSSDLALLIRSEDLNLADPDNQRFRATAFDLGPDGRFEARSSGSQRLFFNRGRWYIRRSRGSAQIADIEMITPETYLFLPVGTVALESRRTLLVDRAGGVHTRSKGRHSYRVIIDPEMINNDPPQRHDEELYRRSARLDELARSIVTRPSDATGSAKQLETWLSEQREYDDQMGKPPSDVDPIEWFLFDNQAGHCEYFAGSMVVLLRHLGIPARMIGGYIGGSVSKDGDRLLVGKANAHTWVEVWAGPELGWKVYDPTPSVGIPGVDSGKLGGDIKWMWQWIKARWDRYVLTFGFGDQISMAEALSNAYEALRGGWRAAMPAVLSILIGFATLLLIVLVGRSTRSHWRWRSRPAVAALAELERRLERSGHPVAISSTPGEIGEQAGRLWPQAASPAAEIARLAELELYGRSGLAENEVPSVREALSELRRAL